MLNFLKRILAPLFVFLFVFSGWAVAEEQKPKPKPPPPTGQPDIGMPMSLTDEEATGAENHTIRDPGVAGEEETSSGEEIHTDEYGRVKVKLPNEQADQGDPDRPVIIGTVPNPEDEEDEEDEPKEGKKK